MQNLLKEVTYKTIKDFRKKDIVMPGEYSKTFQNYADAIGLDIDNDAIILKDLHQDENKLNHIVQKTNENLQSLGNSAKTAEIAIQNKDDKTLRVVQDDIASMQEKIDFLQRELFTDSLTKAKNRKWFSDYYVQDDKMPSHGHLAFIDLDKFKQINDTHGHLVGDQVLRYLSEFLKKEIQLENAHVIRYAGDEFIYLFDQSRLSEADANALLITAQKKLEGLKLKSKTINNLAFSFSFGLTSYEPQEALEVVLTRADEKMYDNKESRR